MLTSWEKHYTTGAMGDARGSRVSERVRVRCIRQMGFEARDVFIRKERAWTKGDLIPDRRGHTEGNHCLYGGLARGYVK